MTSSIVPTRASDAHPTAPPARGCEASHTRRALLAGAAAAPVLALPAIAAEAEDRRSPTGTAYQAPDPHPAWRRQVDALAARMTALALVSLEDPVELYEEKDRLEDLISRTPACTLAGVSVQLGLLHHVISNGCVPNDTDIAGLANAIATLERLAGEGRA